MHPSVAEILAHTPPWVFILFFYLAWIGILRLRPGVRQLGRIWITPGIFIVWGLVGLFRRPGDFTFVLLHWAVGAVFGGLLGVWGKIPMTVDRPRQLVRLPGSVLPLLRIILIFGAHYLLHVAAALHPDQRSSLMTWDIDVSGASAGYFFGWAIRFLTAYRAAPHADLAPLVTLKT